MFKKRYRTVNNLIVIALLLTATIGMSTIADIGKGTFNDLDDDFADSTPVSGAISGINDYELDYDENTTEYETIGDATPSGTPYAIWYDWPGVYHDAEKTLFDDGEGNPGLHLIGEEDDLMCWAATASNVLTFTKWHYGTTDAAFDYFKDHWYDDGGMMEYGWDWWFDGTNPSQGWAGWSYVDVPGGGFWPTYNFGDYFRSSSDDSLAMTKIDDYLHDGYGVGLAIYKPGGGHAITCWGFTSSSSDYTGIYVTDSDDTKGNLFPHGDKLRYYRVAKSGNTWYLQNYGGSNSWYIGAVQGLGVGPGIAPKVNAGADITTYEGSTISFGGSFINPGPSHTYRWSFGDGSTSTGTLHPTHKYKDNGVYTVKLEVTDEHGDVGSDTLKVTVKNAEPIVHAGPDRSTFEGQALSFSGSFSDPGSDTHTIKWSFGDGSYAYHTLTPTKIYTDNGFYTVTLEVTDDDGFTGFDTLYVTVYNVAPTVNAGSDLTADEGDIVTFSGSYTDPGSKDTHTYSWDFGDGSTKTGTLNPTHKYLDNGVYTVTLTVTDNDGGVGSDTLTVTVYNVAPIVPMYSPSHTDTTTITFEDLNHRQYVGSYYPGLTFSSGAYCLMKPNYNYQGYPPHSGTNVIIDISSGVIRIDFDNPVSMVGAWFMTDSTTVYLKAYNVQGDLLNQTSVYSGYTYGKYADVQSIGINYVIFEDNANYWVLDDLIYTEGSPANEGDEVSFMGTFIDPGTADTHTYSWDFDDGSTATGILSTTHVFTDNGIFTVTLTVTDDDGGVGTASLNIVVYNVAPTADAGVDQVVDEGDLVVFSGSHTDPGSSDTHTYSWDFGDSSPSASGTSVTHLYADNGIYIVTLTVTDDDGGVGTDSLEVTVLNVAPTAEAGVDQTVDEGDVVLFSGSFTDPGTADTHTYFWDFGDGSPVISDTLSPQYIYGDNDDYIVTLTVEDDDGGVGTDTLTVTVNNVAPIVSIESVEQPQLFDLEDLTVIMLETVYFNGTAHDPGSDDLTFTWDFGDGTAVVTTSYLNDPPSFPVDILESLDHVYANPGEYAVTLTVEDDDGGVGVDTLILTVWGPQDLKADAILGLDLSKVGSKHIDRSIDHIIKFIERSLREKYWKDATHLDPKHGTSVFCYEFVATLKMEMYDHYIRHLEKTITRWEAKGYDTTWLKLKLATVLNTQSTFESVIYQLVKADELIVRVALAEAENTPVKLPKFQGKFDKELAKANEYFLKAMEKIEDEDYSKAIRYFCKSWDHAQNAIKFANKEYKCVCWHHHKHYHKHYHKHKHWYC